MKKLRHAVGWFEIPVTNMQRSKRFYETIFEIRLDDVQLPNDQKMALFPTENGTIGGALCQREGSSGPGTGGPLVYLNANPNLQCVLEKVMAEGRKIFIPKTKISDEYGYMAVFEDSEGNRIALHSMG